MTAAAHAPTMARGYFNIDFSLRDDCLRAHVSGANGSLETTLAYWLKIAEEVRRVQPATALVVDEMDEQTPPPEQLHRFVLAMEGRGFEGVRVAYVESHPEQIPQVEVAEIFAREQGYVVRVFADETAAEMWLRHGVS